MWALFGATELNKFVELGYCRNLYDAMNEFHFWGFDALREKGYNGNQFVIISPEGVPLSFTAS